MKAIELVHSLGDWSSGSESMYVQLADTLRGILERGELSPGVRLPAERPLAKALAVSRTTVVRAFEILRAEGWLESRQGSGTRVRRSGAPRVATERESAAVRSFQRNTVFRGLIEAAGSTIEFLGAHLPAAAPFVQEAVAQASEDLAPLLKHHGYMALGLPSLQEAIATHLTRTGLPSTAEQILVTHGAQQAIGLITALYVQSGDTVVLEEPTYLGAIDVFASAGARLSSVPVGRDGVRLELLQEVLAHETPSLIYLMPTFQNPTGVVMPEKNRREIVRLAEEKQIPIIEDNTLADLDHGQLPPPPLGSFARTAPVLTIGSLSKLLWGGLRVGWICAPEPIISRLARFKVMADLGSSLVSQAMAARLLPRARAIREVRRREMRERLDVMAKQLSRILPEWSWQRPAGGLTLWVRLPRANAGEFAQVALRHGVSVVPGPICSARNGCTQFLRLSFALELDEIREGVERLGRAWSVYTPAVAAQRSSLGVIV
jgi:DNA-binding transcriptional MocR family regulator